ncbi:hypothetical protein PoB_005180300 [Plakobranchus ocellatus]|uniref:Uncharacterized protein n=1 Tax=Plakobranchus ocellatus TaxID=259542 RepID=A0AAV4C088_9GAST|nr:hypothetical protein PoB_005180300 [Plakobranchus ocellatus]
MVGSSTATQWGPETTLGHSQPDAANFCRSNTADPDVARFYTAMLCTPFIITIIILKKGGGGAKGSQTLPSLARFARLRYPFMSFVKTAAIFKLLSNIA